MSFQSKSLKVLRFLTSKSLYRYGFTSMFRFFQLKDEPVIVCGAPRSGTTLLISILDSHDDIAAIPFETQLFIKKKDRRWFPWESWNDGFVKLQLFLFFLTVNIEKKNKRWCEKTPYNVLYLDYIFELFNNKVKVIHIIRDGRDVISSTHAHLGNFMTPQKWVKCVRAGLQFKNDHRVLTIRYEDIVMNYAKTTTQIAHFLNIENTFKEDFYKSTGVSDNVSIINSYGNKGLYSAKPISSASVGKKEKSLMAEHEINLFIPAKELMIELGYDKR
jgi:hypothetical protein